MNSLKVPMWFYWETMIAVGTGRKHIPKYSIPANFSFIAGNTKFVLPQHKCIEFDYSEPIPDFRFIENQLTDDKMNLKEDRSSNAHARPGFRRIQ